MSRLKVKLASVGVKNKVLAAHLGVTEHQLSIASSYQWYVDLNKRAMTALKNIKLVAKIISEEEKV